MIIEDQALEMAPIKISETEFIDSINDYVACEAIEKNEVYDHCTVFFDGETYLLGIKLHDSTELDVQFFDDNLGLLEEPFKTRTCAMHKLIELVERDE